MGGKRARPLGGRGGRRLAAVAVSGLPLLIAAVGGRSAETLLFVLFAASLPLIVVMHRRRLRARKPRRATPRRPMLKTLAQLALAVIVAGGGAVTVLLMSVLLAVAAPSLVGDGSALVRVLLVAFVLWPCVSLGRRCGSWWAFVGAVGLLPLLGFAVLVSGSASADAGFAALAVIATAFALALGSLQSEWEWRSTRDRGRTARSRRSASPAGVGIEPGAALAGSNAVARARSNRAY